MYNMATDIRVFYPYMLAKRIRSIYRMADDGNNIRALKAINLTIHNLRYAITPKITEEQINRYLSFLYASTTYANRGDNVSLKHLIWRMYEDIVDDHEENLGEIHQNELPIHISNCIDFINITATN